MDGIDGPRHRRVSHHRQPMELGPIEGHIDIVMNGKAGTGMQAFAAQLNDVDLAAVITYERNAFGNTMGDLVQPSAIKAAR